MTQYFDTKGDQEKVVLTFDFTTELAAGETLTGVPSINVTTFRGVDYTPTNILVSGGGAVDPSGLMFLLPVQGGVPGVHYMIRCVADTTNANKRLELTGILPVVPV